jgi:3-dehydroquinate dehydratase-1
MSDKPFLNSVRDAAAPRVAAIVDRMVALDRIETVAQRGAGILEMRIDCFEEPLDAIIDYCAHVRKNLRLPMIGTVRENDRTRGNRLRLFEAIAPHVDCIDIEIDADIAPEIITLARDKTIMISEHDFESTPDMPGLQRIADTALGMGADIVKIATMATSRADVRRLLRFTEESEAHLTTMAMGPIGAVSRFIAPLFGSLFTYGYIDEPVAPGQLPAEELAALIRRFVV